MFNVVVFKIIVKGDCNKISDELGGKLEAALASAIHNSVHQIVQDIADKSGAQLEVQIEN